MISSDPKILLSMILLTRGISSEQQFEDTLDPAVDMGAIKYFSQDYNGEWYGYRESPFIDDSGIWSVDGSGYMYLGKTEVQDDQDTVVYEVKQP